MDQVGERLRSTRAEFAPIWSGRLQFALRCDTLYPALLLAMAFEPYTSHLQLVCDACGSIFEAKRRRSPGEPVFCSKNCQVRGYRLRSGAATKSRPKRKGTA
jgi:hypothetical protein